MQNRTGIAIIHPIEQRLSNKILTFDKILCRNRQTICSKHLCKATLNGIFKVC